MMGLLSFLTNAQVKETDLPWYGRVSLFKFISENIACDGRVSEAGQKLPDEDLLYQDNEPRWVAGGKDGSTLHHVTLEDDGKTSKKIAKLVKSIAAKGKLKHKVELYNILTGDSFLAALDPAIELIARSDMPISVDLIEFARWLAFESPDRGAVKFGVVLLSLIDDPQSKDKVIILGRHEEFSVFVAETLLCVDENWERQLFDFAQYVDGWGRINTVEFLFKTEDPEIKQWMLLEGYKNNVMYEYLAYICAVTGDLLMALQVEHISQQLLDAATDIIEALLIGGPAKDINDYQDAAAVMALYLAHLEANQLSIVHFNVLKIFQDYLENADGKNDWDELAANGWTTKNREHMLEKVQCMVDSQIWTPRVLALLDSDDGQQFWQIKRAAAKLNINLWPTVWQKLNAKPDEQGLWLDAMNMVEMADIDKIITLAERVIPLDKIATGPADEMGLSEAYRDHQILDSVVFNLDSAPGKGIDLIIAALQSPVIRNRNSAVNSLLMWDKSYLTPQLVKTIEKVIVLEPDLEIKENMGQLLS